MTNEEGLLSQLSHRSFDHEGKGESHDGQAYNLVKNLQIFKWQEPPRHPPIRIESQDQTVIWGSKLHSSH